MKKALLLLSVCILGLVGSAQEIFDMPGATGTYLTGINDSGEICGYYTKSGKTIAFEINNYGDTIKLNPGSYTYCTATGISNKGMVAGNFGASSATAQGFIFLPNPGRNAGGTYNTTVTSTWGGTNMMASGITDDTCVAGSYQVGGNDDGALWCNSYAQVTDLRCSNVGTIYPTYLYGLDKNGNVGGFIIQGAQEQAAIYRGAGLGWDTFSIGGNLKSRVLGMNDNGWICGNYSNQTRGYYGRKLSGQNITNITNLIITGSTTICPYDINNNKDIVGYYTDAAGSSHGFLIARYDIGFKPSVNGYGFDNTAADSWIPAYYNQFNYTKDPYWSDTTSFPKQLPGNTVYPSITDDAWPDMVRSLVPSTCYNIVQGHKRINQAAYQKWGANIQPNFQGSCFGFTNTAMEIFDNSLWYFNHFTASQAFQGTPTPAFTNNNTILTAIHQTQCFEVYSQQQNNNRAAHSGDTPKQTFQAIKQNLRNSRGRPHKILGIKIPGGGHAIAPYKLVPGFQGNGIDTVYVYDPNYHGVDDLYVNIDAAGKWHYTAGGRHGDYGLLGNAFFFLALPDSTFQRPLNLGLMPSATPVWRSLDSSITYFTCYFNDSSAVQMTDDSSNTARVAYDTSYSTALISIKWRLGGLNYMRPAGAYCLGNKVMMNKNTLSGYKNNYLAVSGEGYFLRCDRTVGTDTSDNYAYDANHITYLDNAVHNDTISFILNLDDSTGEHNYYITNIAVAPGNKLSAGVYSTQGMIIENYGPATTYVITTEFVTPDSAKTFMDTIAITGNTTHIILPHDTTYSGIYILVDIGMQGHYEDTIFIHQTINDINEVNAPGITAWPVPGANELFMNGLVGLVSYTIVDVMGRTVANGEMNFGSNETRKFDISNFAPGFYVIKGTGVPQKWNYAFIKQ